MVIGKHQSARMISDEWFTPPELLQNLGSFDLDPCTSECRPWSFAENNYTRNDDGLVKDWYGRVWLNPPYGRNVGKWLSLQKNSGCSSQRSNNNTNQKVN